jgi:hypothetical protein
VSRARHRTSSPLRDFWGEVWYLVGRIGLLLLLLLAAMAIIAGTIALVTWLGVMYLHHYVDG